MVLYSGISSDYNDAAKEIENTRSEGQTIFDNKLNNPPSKYQEEYDDMKELIDCVGNLCELALNPSGSLLTYTESYKEADNKGAEALTKVSNHFNGETSTGSDISVDEKDNETKDLQHIEEIKAAVETYAADHYGNNLPSTITISCPTGSKGYITYGGIKEGALSEYGLGSSTDNKVVMNMSSEWTGGTYEWSFNTSTWKWSAPSGIHAKYFYADGTEYK